MSTFRFNFSGDNDVQASEDTQEDAQWLESNEIIPNKHIDLDNMVKRAKMITCGDVEIGHVLIDNVMTTIEDDGLNAIKQADEAHSDLIAAKYEGGSKIWECTIDLLEYLEKNIDSINLENKKVLDLGCGAGILGIYALMNKVSNVTFQDYNAEVLEHVTIPNVLLNFEEEERISKMDICKFYSGDWASFNQKCQERFDVIITSETIYNPSNFQKLVSLFLDKLSENGAIYLAAKTYYFGVGGGTRDFEQVLKNNGSLCSEICWKSAGGIQREILKITKV